MSVLFRGSDNGSLSRIKEGSEDASSFLLSLKLTFNPNDNTQDIITFPRTPKMTTNTMLPLEIAGLTPFNSELQSHQRALAYTCFALPLLYASILLYAKSILFTVESIFAIICSLLALPAPCSINFGQTPLSRRISLSQPHSPVDMVFTVVSCFLSSMAITALVGAIMRPPKRFDYKAKSDHRSKMGVETLYQFHIYTVPLQLWTVLEYLTMI